MVVVYALSTCPWCKKVRNFLTENQVDFKAIEVDLLRGQEQEQALSEVDKLTGERKFPVVLVGDKVIQGYDPEKILEVLRNEA
ncbi:glutaredoxin family protein [Desulforamulus ruminis]|uniref:Glutaredoxin n=1 Tax=Desulforamulus ruminis (strain ATCC 23193 / DSM 2154 / NCIMB 8452 / DL) TaxID=696281 RepID=F6DUU2_DESRL|nr:glutaredoxin family protein [Desulforamulus ruminis]AEG60230.1 glutaredoxin [Desulforamulus ruminis DSM 2154]